MSCHAVVMCSNEPLWTKVLLVEIRVEAADVVSLLQKVIDKKRLESMDSVSCALSRQVVRSVLSASNGQLRQSRGDQSSEGSGGAQWSWLL